MAEQQHKVLEEGELFFFFRPVVDEHEPGGLVDVQQFYLVMRPVESKRLRLLVVGRKRLPPVEENERNWGFVDLVDERIETVRDALAKQTYDTRTLGERTNPPARPVGEGVYAVYRDGRDTRFAYVLRLPEQPDEAQQALNIEEEAVYILSVKNPEAGQPAQAGLAERKKADFPDELLERFDGRRWTAADPIDFLDHEGAELLLIAATTDVPSDIEREVSEEVEVDAEKALDDLRARQQRQPVKPLFEGDWA